jgi:hypothetical protein
MRKGRIKHRIFCTNIAGSGVLKTKSFGQPAINLGFIDCLSLFALLLIISLHIWGRGGSMKISLKVIACMAALAVLMVVQSASAQGKLEGVWRVTEVILPVANGGKLAVSAAHPNLMIFTKKHFSFLNIAAADGTRPVMPQNATDAQKVAAWTNLVAWTGTYEVKGNIVTFHNIVDKDPGGMLPGGFWTAEFKIEGDTFTWTAKTDQNGPVTTQVTSKLVRVE